jgi:uncharacterized repeat protein (TIGR04138 family)
MQEWGMLAPIVLRKWNIASTHDFGRIVFALVENRLMQKSEEDSLSDFDAVYDFATAFDAGYCIELKS